MIASIPIELIEFEPGSIHLHVTAKISNHSITLLLDTGASKTVLDEAQLRNTMKDCIIHEHDQKSVGLGTNAMDSKSTIIEEMRFGKLRIPDLKLVVLDLFHLNDTYNEMGLLPVDGVLGSDLLNRYKAIIDYEKRALLMKA